MGNEANKDIEKPIPSEGPLKNEPTPERAQEEKKKHEKEAGKESPQRDNPAR